MIESKSIVSLMNVGKRYGEFAAVDTMSLEVMKGELLCLLGPSGCGKTTTLRMIAGFVEPTSGKIYIEGCDVTRLPPYRRDTGMVFQNYALFPHLTVSQNIAFGLQNMGAIESERQKRVGEMLDLVELPALANRFPKELSGGQQQRVALARALAMNPAVLLLDEPFSNLDAQLRIRLREELRALIKRISITTLFVTHDQEEALMLSDRIVVMNGGRVEQNGTPAEIYESPKTRFVANFIGRCSMLAGQVGKDGIFTAGDLRLPMNEPPGPRTIFIRPQYIRPVDDQNRAVSSMDATVLSTNYSGALTQMRLLVSGQELLMDTHFPDGLGPSIGDYVPVCIDPAGVRSIAGHQNDR
jgi:putative spermidine/putrescine transport system ATP-binding protein